MPRACALGCLPLRQAPSGAAGINYPRLMPWHHCISNSGIKYITRKPALSTSCVTLKNTSIDTQGPWGPFNLLLQNGGKRLAPLCLTPEPMSNTKTYDTSSVDSFLLIVLDRKFRLRAVFAIVPALNYFSPMHFLKLL